MNEEEYLWVARDKDGDLFLFRESPSKDKERGLWCSYDIWNLDPNLFPNVKWEDDEPTPVVLQQALFKSKESKENGQ